MRPVRPDWGLAFQVWWAFFWRTMLLALCGGVVLGAMMGVVGGMAGLGQETVTSLSGFMGAIFGILAGCWVLKRMMTIGFGKYLLVVSLK